MEWRSQVIEWLAPRQFFAPSATWPWPGAAARPGAIPLIGNAIPLIGNAITLIGNAITLNGNAGVGWYLEVFGDAGMYPKFPKS